MRARSSFTQERELVLADLELVAVLERLGGLDPLAVEERAVEAALVLDVEVVVALDQDGVRSRDGHVVEEDVAVGRTADRRALALREEVLSGAAAARSHDQRGPLRPEVLEAERGLLVDVLGRVAHRLFRAGLALDEQRAAAGA